VSDFARVGRRAVAELFPVGIGFFAGVLVSRAAGASTPWGLCGLCALVIGLSATVLSGEWLQSWLFLLIDVSEAFVMVALGDIVARRFPASRRPKDTVGG